MDQTTTSPPTTAAPRPLARRGCLQALGAVWLLVGLAAVLFYLTNRADPETVWANTATIQIAIQAPLSGEQAPYGQAMVNGASLAVANRAERLRSLGYRVELVPFDDQALPQVAANNAARIARSYNILAVIGHLNSAPTSAALPSYRQANLLVVNPASSNPALTREGRGQLLRIMGRDDLQAAAGLGYALQQLQTRQIYLVQEDSPYGQAIATAFRQEAQRLGITIVGDELVAPAVELDLTETISNTSPHLVYFAGLADQAGPLFQQLHEAGLETVYFMGPDSLDAPEMAALAPDIRGRLFYTRLAAPAVAYQPPGTEEEPPSGPVVDFIADYQARFGRPPDEYALHGYDAALIVLNALEQARRSRGEKPRRADVLAAGRTLSRVEGLLQVYSFTPQGEAERSSYLVYQFNELPEATWADNGPVALIWYSAAGR